MAVGRPAHTFAAAQAAGCETTDFKMAMSMRVTYVTPANRLTYAEIFPLNLHAVVFIRFINAAFRKVLGEHSSSVL